MNKPARAATNEAPTGRVVGMITIAVVTHENVPVHEGGDSTIGQMIDEHLAVCAHEGREVREVRFDIEDRQDWHRLAEHIRATTRRID